MADESANNDSDSDLSDIESLGTCSGISSCTSMWSLSDSSEHTISTDNDTSIDSNDLTGSLGTNSSLHSLSSIQSYNSIQNVASVQGTSLGLEPHNENHGNSELTTTINNDFSDLNCKKPIPIFKTEGPEVDKLKEQSQCTVDSNILAEFKNKKDMHSLSTYSDHDLVHNGKGPQNIERNASTVKPRNSREVTNDINPMHQSVYDSHVPKQKVAIDIEESSKLCETIVENGEVQV